MLQPVSRSAKGNPRGSVVPALIARPSGRPHLYARPRGRGFKLARHVTPRQRRAPVDSIDQPHEIVETDDGYEVVNVVRIEAGHHRNRAAARGLAQRVAHAPLTYIRLVLLQTGTADLRPTFGKVVAHG